MGILATPERLEWETPYGIFLPIGAYGLAASRHMAVYGTKPEELAQIAVDTRRWAAMNERANQRELITVEDVLDSGYVAEPMHKLEYCLVTDGAGAIVVTSAERARDLAKPPVYIRGAALQTVFVGSMFPPEDLWHGALSQVADRSFAEAGLAREDMSALMIYDNFTPTVLFSLEGCGYCGRGESGPFVAEGRLALGGRYPTNTSGGHLSESYMQGWALNVEAVRQIRGVCGARQVKDAAHVHYMGAAPVCASIIYAREAS
jgi:acetyl-CoA acetyltransferase